MLARFATALKVPLPADNRVPNSAYQLASASTHPLAHSPVLNLAHSLPRSLTHHLADNLTHSVAQSLAFQIMPHAQATKTAAAPLYTRQSAYAHQSWSGFAASLGDRLFDSAQHFIVDVLPKLVIIALFTWVLIRVLTLITDRMARMSDHHAAAATRSQQARTLSSVIRATGIGILIFLAVLQALPMLGFNLGPLLTSAGVAGVAIGLACQTIVKDCLNGMLILLEDQYNVGDVIKIAGLSGQVEAMTLRKTTLRDGDGTLYLIPNSQITTVANQTRDWSVATVNVAVDFSAHPDEVVKVLTEVANSVRNDPAYKDSFLADPTLLGVDLIKGSQVIYPIILKTRANEQWGAQRELQRRVRIALMEHNMLPGDPNRVYNLGAPTTTTGAHLTNEPAPKPDPTTLKPHEVNPFTGEGM